MFTNESFPSLPTALTEPCLPSSTFQSSLGGGFSMLRSSDSSTSSSASSMPVLEHIKRVFQHEFGSDFSKLPNRNNTLFVIVQHGFATVLPMMKALLELGVPSDHVFMTTKPHTTSDEMSKNFSKMFEANYVPFQWKISEPKKKKQWLFIR